jgi:predicted nucleotidyltransferase
MITNKIIQAINTAENHPFITRVGVFGSCARGEKTNYDDIDLLIDYDNSSEEYLDDFDAYIDGMRDKVDRPIDFITYNGLIKSPDDVIKKNILNDLIWIYQKC